MAKQTRKQQKTVARVMHEFKHGELETSHGRKVRNPRQAIAIGLREAGASNKQNPDRKAERRRRTSEHKEAGSNRRTRAELYAEARERNIPGRSRMSRDELEKALR